MRYYLLFAALALSLAACTNDNEVMDNGPVAAVINAEISDAVATRASGTQASLAQSVEVYGYTTCTNNEGAPVTDGSTKGWLKMKHTIYADDTECWEANVVPGTIDLTNFIRLNGHAVLTESDLSGFNYTSLDVAKMYTINLTVDEPVTEITADNCNNISGTDNYIVRDNFGQTITVTITGDSRDDKLTVRGNNGGSGIGGYVISSNNGATCGNITISDVTIISYGSGDSMSSDMAAGIGSAVGASCGNIAIENATVHAYGVLFDPIATPAIGCGYPSSGIPKSIPVVKISNDSDIHAHRGGSVGNTDYIGWAGSSWGMNANSTINLGGGTCTSSTVYCYTGDGNIVDKIVVYDANGNATQK